MTCGSKCSIGAGANHYVFLSNEADVLREMRAFLGRMRLMLRQLHARLRAGLAWHVREPIATGLQYPAAPPPSCGNSRIAAARRRPVFGSIDTPSQ